MANIYTDIFKQQTVSFIATDGQSVNAFKDTHSTVKATEIAKILPGFDCIMRKSKEI